MIKNNKQKYYFSFKTNVQFIAIKFKNISIIVEKIVKQDFIFVF